MADNKNTTNEGLFSERTISVVLGLIVVLVVGGLIFNYLKGKTEKTGKVQEIQEEGQKEEKEFGAAVELPTVYRVVEGDYLWKIAQKFYRSGYNWVDIALENNLANPDRLAIGQELKIPDVKSRKATILPETGISGITSGKYTVQKGDWLSKIALRAYGDMFAWGKIYEANKATIGANPHLLEEGQVLTIPE